MPNTPRYMPQDRIYSEEEIGRVLKRAAEIQGKQGKRTGYGLSLEEMQELASESGIDPDLVVAAVSELKADQNALKRNWWGGPLSYTTLQSIEGQISDETWEELLGILRRKYKDTGDTEQRGTTRQWTSRAQDGRRAHLIATYRAGRTELELFYGNPTIAIPFYILPLIGSMIMLPIIFEGLSLSGLPAFLVWLAAALAMVGTVRTGVSWKAGNMYASTKETLDELSAVAIRRSRQQKKGKGSARAPEPVETEQVSAPAKTRSGGAYIQVPSDEYASEEDSGSRDRSRER